MEFNSGFKGLNTKIKFVIHTKRSVSIRKPGGVFSTRN